MVPPQYLPYFATTAAGIGGMVSSIGVLGLLSPQTALTQVFEFSAPRTPQDRKLVNGLMQIFGVRDLALGLSVLTVWSHGCRGGDTRGYAALGSILLLGAGVSTVDGVVSGQVIGSGQWKHWGFIPVLIGLSGGLMGWV